MKDVFISYKTEEFDEANWVRVTLEHNGISCWMAPMCIPGGSSYAVEIPQAIRNCTVFVLLLSEKSQASKWVPRELDQAINEGKVVMPFMLEDCALKDDFNFYLTNVQRYNAYESKAATMQKMIGEIKAILAQRSPAAGAVPPPTEPVEEPVEPKAPAEPVTPAAPPKAPKPTQPSKAPKSPKPPKTPKAPKAAVPRKRAWLLPAILAAVVAVCVLVGVLAGGLASGGNKVTVAGVVFAGDTGTVELEGKALTGADLETLAGLESLHYLSLTACTLPENLAPIGDCGLSTLQMVRCGVTQTMLDTLTLPEDLYRLDLSGNPDVTTLSGLGLGSQDYLYELNLSDTGVQDLASVGELKKLETLWVNRTGLTSLKGLETCLYLAELHAVGNQLTSLEGLENTSQLERVYLNDNALTDITPLSRSAEKLRVVQVNGNALTTLDALKECAALQYVCADRNQLTDISALNVYHSALAGLSAADNRLVTVPEGWGLAGDNVYLDLSGNRIEGRVALLGENQRLQLDLSNNPGVEWVYVKDATYTNLSVWGTPAAENPAKRLEILLENVSGSTVVLDYGEGMEKATVPEEISITEIKIVDCPLSARVAMEELLGSYRVEFISAEEAAGLSMALPYEMRYEE